VLWDDATNKFAAILDDDLHISMSESPDGLSWAPSVLLFQYDEAHGNAQYATPVSPGKDPYVLGSSFYIYYTHYPTNGTGWDAARVDRFKCSAIRLTPTRRCPPKATLSPRCGAFLPVFSHRSTWDRAVGQTPAKQSGHSPLYHILPQAKNRFEWATRQAHLPFSPYGWNSHRSLRYPCAPVES
jgi:hypothetical protein